ncbi:uncharacterized protein LOC126902842 isoform X2 [Daktulosphaira vitifoliae]|nr:uncharacterized protein LOC126902842 isoform X2 [Daktulosphaira vitifoliae]
MPYNKNTILDDLDLDIVQSKYFNPRKCKKPWTLTQQNEIDVPVPIDDAIGKKLGNIIKPCIKNNTNIIQCYTQYLNVIESVGLTLVDRFCLFILEVIDRLDDLNDNADFINDFSLFDITINFAVLNIIIEKFAVLFYNILSSFKRYYISTLPLDCVSDVLTTFTTNIILYDGPFIEDLDVYYEQLLKCRELMKSKKNYVVLDNDQYWKWDYTSDYKPGDDLMILAQQENNIIGLNLFATIN